MTAIVLEKTPEEFLGQLTDAAYQVALRHGLRGSFLDVELELWRELRAVLRREILPVSQRVPAERKPRRIPKSLLEVAS